MTVFILFDATRGSRTSRTVVGVYGSIVDVQRAVQQVPGRWTETSNRTWSFRGDDRYVGYDLEEHVLEAGVVVSSLSRVGA